MWAQVLRHVLLEHMLCIPNLTISKEIGILHVPWVNIFAEHLGGLCINGANSSQGFSLQKQTRDFPATDNINNRRFSPLRGH